MFLLFFFNFFIYFFKILGISFYFIACLLAKGWGYHGGRIGRSWGRRNHDQNEKFSVKKVQWMIMKCLKITLN